MANLRQSRYPGLPLVIKYLIIINVVVFLIQVSPWGGQWMLDYFALHDVRSSLFKPHQLLTHLFLHGGWAHILLNMFALWMFGSTLENYWGPKRFLNFFLITGIGAGAIYLGVFYFQHNGALAALDEFRLHPSQELLDEIVARYHVIVGSSNDPGEMYAQMKFSLLSEPVLGASGAIFGVLVAFGYTFPNTEMFIIPIPFPVKAKYLVIGYICIELYSGFANRPGDDVAHFAHLGGALVGFILVWTWNRTNRKDFY
jgi:membrane associated rhomboid family serine protease